MHALASPWRENDLGARSEARRNRALEPRRLLDGFWDEQTQRGRDGGRVISPSHLAKSFYHLAISCVCIPLIFFRLQGNDKWGKKSLFAFHPGVLGEGYLCQILSLMVRGFSFPLPENREAPPESNLSGKRRKESLSGDLKVRWFYCGEGCLGSLQRPLEMGRYFPLSTQLLESRHPGQEGEGQRGSWKGRRERQFPFVQMSIEHLVPIGAKSAAAESDRNL